MRGLLRRWSRWFFFISRLGSSSLAASSMPPSRANAKTAAAYGAVRNERQKASRALRSRRRARRGGIVLIWLAPGRPLHEPAHQACHCRAIGNFACRVAGPRRSRRDLWADRTLWLGRRHL